MAMREVEEGEEGEEEGEEGEEVGEVLDVASPTEKLHRSMRFHGELSRGEERRKKKEEDRGSFCLYKKGGKLININVRSILFSFF